MRIRFVLSLTALLTLSAATVGCRGCRARPEPQSSTSQKTPGDATLVVIGWWVDEGRDIIQALIGQFTRETGINVKLVPESESAAETLDVYLKLLKDPGHSPDVYLIDVTWIGILAEHMIDLTPYLAEEAKSHLQAIVANNTVNGKLVGMPSFVDFGLLFYRTDLLAKYGYRGPPGTWDELERMAARIQAGERAGGNQQFWGYVWQGAAYEGLTCNALEWQVSHGGGSVIEPDGTVTVNNPRTIRALKRAAGWVGTISPPSVTAYHEEDARLSWQSGNAAFMRNWPEAVGAGQRPDSAIKGRFDVTLPPSGGAGRAAALGGWQLAVSRHSTHRDQAVAFVRFMTSRNAQIQLSLAVSFPPTILDVYDDPKLREARPHFGRLRELLLAGPVARPSTVTGKSYAAVSEAYFKAVHSVLTRKSEAEPAVSDLEKRLVEITGFEASAQ